MKKTIAILLVVIGVVFISPRQASALTYSSDVGVQFTFNPTLEITLSSADLVISNLSPGTVSDSNIIDVIVKTNNITGYTLNATVGNNTTYNTRNLVHELSGSSASFASINYGSSLASLTTDNTWGYSYSADNKTTWSNYDGLPIYSDATNIATLKEATSPSASAGDIINFKIAAKASTTQSSGEYNNVINFITIANPVPTLGPVACASGKICYNANVLDPTEVEGTMGKPNASANTSITLLASNFSREGYGFAGWSDSYDYAYNSNAQLYGPQEDITAPSDMSSGLALYAIWIPSAGSMQTDATTTCSGLTAATSGLKSLSSVSALTDQRDNQTYAIAKLANGTCWMIENLRLESTAAHNSDGTLAQGYGTSATYGNFSGLADAESTGFSPTYTANSLYYSGTQEGTASIDIGTSNYPAYRMPRYNNANTSARASSPTSNGEAMYSYGNYYTWHAAIADTTAYTSNNTSVTNTSLCPAGWHLPKGGNKSNEANNDFWSLIVTGINGGTNPANYESSTEPYYTGSPEGSDASKAIRAYPNNFLYSGVFSYYTVGNRGVNGRYWLSTASNSLSSYGLWLGSSSVIPGTDDYVKNDGYSIRCTASI